MKEGGRRRRDFRGKFADGTLTVLRLCPDTGATILAPIDSLGDDELETRAKRSRAASARQ